MMTLVHFDEATIHLMQFSLVIFRCNITFSVFWLSQGSVATLIRWGGWSLYCHMFGSFINLLVKTALKSVDFWQSYRQKQVGSFLWPTVYMYRIRYDSTKDVLICADLLVRDAFKNVHLQGAL